MPWEGGGPGGESWEPGQLSFPLRPPARVSEEKESRGYLQATVTRLAQELESLKQVGTPASGSPVRAEPGAVKQGQDRVPWADPCPLASQDGQWRARRLQRLETSTRRELQSALEAEIRARQELQDELGRSRADQQAAERCGTPVSGPLPELGGAQASRPPRLPPHAPWSRSPPSTGENPGVGTETRGLSQAAAGAGSPEPGAGPGTGKAEGRAQSQDAGG